MSTRSMVLLSTSVDDTLSIGKAIGATLSPGDVIALMGELGSGKTHLVKGLADGLGIADRRLVHSPTFVLVNEYAGRHRLYHLDAYRLSGAAELSALGFEEMREDGAVVVEWADRARELMGPAALWVELVSVGETHRQLSLSLGGDEWDRRLRSQLAAWERQDT